MFRQIHREVHWNELSKEQRLETSQALESPFITDFLADIDGLNETISEAGIRRYLSMLLTLGEIRLRSPFDGKSISSSSSFITNDRHCLISFLNIPGILIVISDLGSGFPISSVVFVSGAMLMHLTSTPWVIALSRLHDIDYGAISDRTPPSVAHLSIVVGDANFAHHAWNQLPAISDLLRAGLLNRIHRIIVTHEPLGPIQAIFPELPKDLVIRVPDSYLEGQNEPGSLIVLVGSRVLTEEVVSRIYAVAANESDVSIRSQPSSKNPTLWISVRTRGRTPVNQVDLLTAVGREFLTACPNGTLIIDGHSTPMDVLDENVYNTRTVSETILNDREVAKTVEEHIRSLLYDLPRDKIITAVGLPILESIYLASTATFYFCHHGTVQHKIGWFTSCRGIVHSSRKVISMMPEDWVAAQSTVAVRPTYLDRDLVVDMPYDTVDAKMSSLHLGNYMVLECDAVARFVTIKALGLSS